MSKVAAGMAAVVLGGGTVTASAILLPKWLNGFDAELVDTLEKFKSEGHKNQCVSGLFSGLEQLESTDSTATTSAAVATDFFGTDRKTTGCLVVNWDKDFKEENNSTKWRGTFRLLWAVKGEKTEGNTSREKGFIVFLVGKTPSDAGQQKIQWEGTVYTLTYSGDESSGKKWTPVKSPATPSAAEKAFNKQTGGSTTDKTKFPQAGTALKAEDEKTTIGDFWGWFTDVNALDHILISDDETKTEFLRAYWRWNGSEGVGGSEAGHKLTDWTSGIDSWWTEVFDAAAFKVKDASNERSGTWQKLKFLKNSRNKSLQNK